MTTPPKPHKPPGRRLLKNMSTRTKWLLLSPISLMMIGYGLCVFHSAAMLKEHGEPFSRWFLLGTYSLVVINAGISLFGQAIVYRAQMTIRREYRRRLKKEIRLLLKKENPVRKP
ncbi:hypothetical protein [Tellurirhabdus rosea]|uniref:hypothetical protein n=1 Tax=Tellurirhabdus rosea TaxID=2674997 RepID=UPI0022561BAD|nr:hypothetical protein [Tellurirhabdus rosea]